MEDKLIKKRTITQNSALHLWFQQLADALTEAGLDMRVVLKPEIEIKWTGASIKEYLWKPVMEKMFGNKSTTEMTTTEIDEIFEVITKHLSEKFGEWCDYVPFPSIETLIDKLENKVDGNLRIGISESGKR